MDEQQTNQSTLQPEQPQQVSNPEPVESFDSTQGNSGDGENLAVDGAALVDGELRLGDEFFSDFKDIEAEEGGGEGKREAVVDGNRTGEAIQTDIGQQQGTEPQQTPSYYTDDELASIPFQQWDLSRVGGDVVRYAQAVQKQIAQATARATAQAAPIPQLPDDIVKAPAPYTPRALSDDARKLACEKLGLKEAEDFDDYEGEHRAALELAMQELIQKRNSEISDYQRTKTEWDNLYRFHAELTQQPDYPEFCQWYMAELQKMNMSPLQMNDKLLEIVKNNGNRFGIVQQTILNWYRSFQNGKTAQKAQPQPQTQVTPQNPKPRVTPPAPLESTRGNNYQGGYRVNLSDFGQMSSDEQAEALIKLGLV